jgi:hypothetical protein
MDHMTDMVLSFNLHLTFYLKVQQVTSFYRRSSIPWDQPDVVIGALQRRQGRPLRVGRRGA